MLIRAALCILHKNYATYKGKTNKNKMGLECTSRMDINEDHLYFDSSIT